MEERTLERGWIPGIRMVLLCYEQGRLTGIHDNIDRLTDFQLRKCLEHQKTLGREVAFELVW